MRQLFIKYDLIALFIVKVKYWLKTFIVFRLNDKTYINVNTLLSPVLGSKLKNPIRILLK